MDGTPRWALPFLFAGQAQKEMFHNEALVRIDAQARNSIALMLTALRAHGLIHS